MTMYEPQEDSYLLLESIKNYAKQHKINTALDMGTGSGILGLELAQHAKTVIMTDINPNSIMLLEQQLNKFTKKQKISAEIRLYSGDLFENIPYEFSHKIDLIVFNPPYLPREADEEDDLELTSGESGIETTKRFLTQAKKFLSHNGTIMFIASSLSDIISLEHHMTNENYSFSIERSQHISFEDIIIYQAQQKNEQERSIGN